MYSSSLNIFSISQEVKIDATKITASSDGLNSYLHIPVDFILRSRNDKIFETVSVTSKLRLISPYTILSEVSVAFPRSLVNVERDYGALLTFPLSENAIRTIEDNRNNDAGLNVEISLLYLQGQWKTLAGSKEKYWDNFHEEKCNIPIYIPKSTWVEQMLGQLNYQSFKLIQVPLNHRTLAEAYPKIIAEFIQAEKYFNLKDYNQCVAHCRKTLDPLHTELGRLKAQIGSKSNFAWLDAVSSETKRWITEMDKNNFAITSKPHHSGLERIYTKSEAESIYLVILGLLNYIGNL